MSVEEVLVDARMESSRSLLSLAVSLLFVSGLRLEEASLGLNGEFSLLFVVLVCFLVHSLKSGQVGVQVFQRFGILQRISLLVKVMSLVFSAVSDSSLNGIGVDDSSNIRVGQDSLVKVISALLLRSQSVRSEDLVKRSEGRFSPDDESSEMSTRSQLSKVKSVNVRDFNTRDVSNSSDEVDVFITVDEKRASSKSVSSVSELALTSSDDLGVGNSFNILISTESSKESNSFLGFFNAFDLVINNQRKVWNVLDSVASSEDERSDSGSSKSSSNSMSLLLDVNFSVPSSPGL